MEKEIHFVNKIVKQGNSLCVRIPLAIVKEGKLKEGMEVLMSMIPKEIDYTYNEDYVKHLIKIADKVKELDRYSEFSKRLYILLNFQYLEQFISTIKKEFGHKFLTDFLDFEEIFNKEAFETGEEGIPILKKEFR